MQNHIIWGDYEYSKPYFFKKKKITRRIKKKFREVKKRRNFFIIKLFNDGAEHNKKLTY